LRSSKLNSTYIFSIVDVFRIAGPERLGLVELLILQVLLLDLLLFLLLLLIFLGIFKLAFLLFRLLFLLKTNNLID
jgi:hypothetical protein